MVLATNRLAEKGSPEFGAAAPTVHRSRRQGSCRVKSVRCGHTTFETPSRARSNQARSSDRRAKPHIRAQFDHTAISRLSTVPFALTLLSLLRKGYVQNGDGSVKHKGGLAA